MGMQPEYAGTAFRCDYSGTIKQIVRNDSGMLDGLAVGQLLADVIDPASHDKMQNFLKAVNEQGAAFDWELNVRDGDQLTTLHFAGIHYDPDEVLIVLARTGSAVMALFDDMMRMNNEQVNHLRRVIKEQSERSRTKSEHDSALYDELSRLNNELANLQRELVKKNAELERLDKQKNRFLGMAAHDLRSPLSVILMYSDFIMQEAGDMLNEEAREFLSIIMQSSRFMTQLIDDLLDITVIESGQLVLSPVPTDIVDLVRHNVELNNVLASKKNIDIRFEVSTDTLVVHIDPERITQVLNNLIGNAIKFSESGGQILVGIALDSDNIILTVQDHGKGVSPEQLHMLFDRFIGLSTRGTAGEKGTGLGLAISHKIVTEHGGTIDVDSVVGEGTTFTITLPCITAGAY
ncbi:MAG: HAMP domain-containing histidine kinase [Anaerolineae bacterium]|nr:HAMP domain-containing histidine kinase [Anaerolineae bacterium]